MKNFGNTLDGLLKDRKMKGVELERVSGVAGSMISRYRSGEYTWLRLDHLARITGAFDQPYDRALLVKAHLDDQRYNIPGAELVSVTIANAPAELKEVAPPYGGISKESETHMQIIREWVTGDPTVKLLIKDLAELLKSGNIDGTGGRKKPNGG